MQCSAGARPSKWIPGSNRLSAGVDTHCISFLPLRQTAPPTHLNFRLRNSVSLQLQRPHPASASKTNPSNGYDESRTKTDDGPPLLTILAGLLVFLVLCWIIGSIVLWLFSLFVPSK